MWIIDDCGRKIELEVERWSGSGHACLYPGERNTETRFATKFIVKHDITINRLDQAEGFEISLQRIGTDGNPDGVHIELPYKPTVGEHLAVVADGQGSEGPFAWLGWFDND